MLNHQKSQHLLTEGNLISSVETTSECGKRPDYESPALLLLIKPLGKEYPKLKKVEGIRLFSSGLGSSPHTTPDST